LQGNIRRGRASTGEAAAWRFEAESKHRCRKKEELGTPNAELILFSKLETGHQQELLHLHVMAVFFVTFLIVIRVPPLQMV